MDRILRGHHLLCIHGFRGMGYSPSFVEQMGQIVKEIRDEEQDFMVEVMDGLDHACLYCPHKGEAICEASPTSNEHVTFMDRKVLQHLGIEKEKKYSKEYLIERTAKLVHPEDLDYLCEGCSWLTYGVCKEGIDQLRKKFESKNE